MLTDPSYSSEEEPLTPHRKKRLIRRRTPDTRPGHPFPGCIMWGWRALLTADEDKAVKFADLPAPRQERIRNAMRACSQWERVNGRLWLARASRRMFKTFLQWKPDGPEDRIGLRLWGETYMGLHARQTRARRAQVTAAAREDAFPVHSVIYRT
jgi:hypothetical protein